MSCSDIFLGVIAILFPPIAVWIKAGLCSADSLINILLCMLGYLPGLIHAWYTIAKYPESDYEAVPDSESGAGRVTYYYVGAGQRVAGNAGAGAGAGGRLQQQQQQQRQQGYGTNASSGVVKAGRPAQQQQGAGAGVGSSNSAATPVAPPSYSEAVAGDHKVQT